jgi:predicted nucleic acid-binding protein
MGPSSLNNLLLPLIVDASVVINLNASGSAAEILRAVPNPVLVVDVVTDELRTATRSKRNDAALLARLVAEGLIAEVSIGDLRQDHFEGLVLGDNADTLDDGEAATIACAFEKGAVAVIDERKAKRICRARFTQLHVASTIDLIGLDVVASSLGPRLHAESVFKALIDGRMRVLPEHLDWVVGLIGIERAAQCPSLPGHARARASKVLLG